MEHAAGSLQNSTADALAAHVLFHNCHSGVSRRAKRLMDELSSREGRWTIEDGRGEREEGRKVRSRLLRPFGAWVWFFATSNSTLKKSASNAASGKAAGLRYCDSQWHPAIPMVFGSCYPPYGPRMHQHHLLLLLDPGQNLR